MVNGVELFFSLFTNLAIFIASVAIYSYLLAKFDLLIWYKRQAILGLSFGLFAIGCKHAQIPVFEGVIVDQSNAIVVLSGVFGGPLSAFISGGLIGAFRVFLGGGETLAGVLGVCLAALTGIGLHMCPRCFKSLHRAAISAFLASLIILPGFLFVGDIQTGWNLMLDMSLPYGLAIFLGVFVGGLLLNREDNRYLARLLFHENEQKYRELVEETNELITHMDKTRVLLLLTEWLKISWDFPRKDVLGDRPTNLFIQMIGIEQRNGSKSVWS